MRPNAEFFLFSFTTALLVETAAPSQPAAPNAQTYVIPLSGGAEVSDIQAAGLGGDLDGAGLVKLTVDRGRKQICYDFEVAGVATPLMAHIHKGPALGDGPSVVTLFTGPGGDLDDCLKWTEKWLVEINSNPSDFYVNFYTTEYPDGAIRGQLSS